MKRKIISSREPKPYRVENAAGKGLGLVICDHASHVVPKSLKDLGLRKVDLKKHIGWDIGAENISRYIGKALDMPVILANYSRLVVDLNRAMAHPECMAAVSDNISVPANQRLSKAEKEQRLREIYKPYQAEIGKQADRFTKKGKVPVLIAVHSFTPVMGAAKRPWHISILWHKEEKIAKALVRMIRKIHPDVLVGENQPYSLFDERFAGSTIDCHAERRNLPYIFVEFRQDLVDTKQKATHWANIFLQALRPLLEDTETTHQDRKVKPLKK